MSARIVQNGIETRSSLLKGALILSRAVAVTYGPHGRNAMLDRPMGIISTRDGVTVAREVDLDDPVENLGAQILKDASITVNNEVGDGTTTTAILAAELLAEGHKLVVAGHDPGQLSAGMQAACAKAVGVIESIAEDVSDQASMETIALLASNGDDEVAKHMAEATMAVGRDGTVMIEDSHGMETTLELKEGMEIDRGSITPAFFTGQKLERVLEGPLVAVINTTLRTVEDVTELMECVTQWKPRELIIIAIGVEGQALPTMVLNNAQGVVPCIAVAAPGFGLFKTDYLRDIAALSGATLVDEGAGMDVQKWDPEWFGSFRQVVVKSRATTFISYDDNHDDLETYVASLRRQQETTGSEYDRDKLKERLARLSGGLAVLKVGGVTEAAMKERRARVEDALGAVRAALRGGIVPGAGSACLIASLGIGEPPADTSSDFKVGWKAFQTALHKPVQVLAGNAGAEGPFVAGTLIEKLTDQWHESREIGIIRDTDGKILEMDPGPISNLTPWIGYDALSGQIRDLRTEPKVIDPALVTISAIKAATSVASTLLTVEVAVSIVRDHQGAARSM
jgi:chaperonin GroEL